MKTKTQCDGSRFALGRATIDGACFEAVLPDGSRAGLTGREIAMLRLFAGSPREVFNRDFLLTRFWSAPAQAEDSALSMAVSRLRAKLGRDGSLIETVHRTGYRYAPRRAG